MMSERTVYSFVFAKPRSEPDNPSEHERRIEYREINVESWNDACLVITTQAYMARKYAISGA